MGDYQLLWDVTGKCNLHCTHCYAYNKYQWREPTLRRPDLTLDEGIALLRKAAAMGFGRVHLLGGEPLLRKDVLDLITVARRELDLRVSMNTNGILLDRPGLIDALIDLEVYQVAVSFEGTRPETHDAVRGNGMFERARRNLKCLGDRVNERGADMLVGVGFVMTRAGLADMADLVDFSLRNSANALSVDYLAHDGEAIDHSDALAYSQDEGLDALEVVTESAIGRLPDGFVFQLTVKPKTRAYLEERFGLPIRKGGYGDHCPAGQKTMLVENDGVIAPCGILNKDNKNFRAVEAGEYVLERMNIHDYDDIEAVRGTDFFQTFSAFRDRERQACSVSICQECSFRDTCQPCPVEFFDQATISECEAVNARHRRWKEDVRRWTLPFAPDVDLGDSNETAKWIVAKLQAGASMDAVTQEISAQSGEKPESIAEDLWDFLITLRNAGYLTLHHEEGGVAKECD